MSEEYPVQPSRSTVRDMPERMRPREELERRGVGYVADDVLVAVILRSGIRGMNVRDLARELLQRYGSLTALASASVEELSRMPGMGRVKAQVLLAALEIGRRLNEERFTTTPPVRTPYDAACLLQADARTLDKEVFWVLHLDAKNRLKGRPAVITSGLLDASLVHPREVFRDAVRSATAAVVLAHNHPSGDPAPSPDDVRVTKQLVDAGRTLDIRVLDHIVVGRPGEDGQVRFVSMREDGIAVFE
jgi:DNA repair protein RadC